MDEANHFDADLDLEHEYWDDIDDDDTLSSDSLDYDGSDNWPLHADCKYDLTQSGKEAWVLSPRSLKNLCALKVVKNGLVACGISTEEIPINLYQTLFVEACRCKCDVTIAAIVATWPHSILDLRDVEIPVDCYRGYYTKAIGSERSLVAMVISGLLRLQPESKLKTILIPESEAEGAALMKLFLQLPALVLRDVPFDIKHQWLLQHCTIRGAVDQLKSAELPPFEHDAFNRDATCPLTIVLPGVVQWAGRSCNHLDVLLGLALSAFTPFRYQFERLSMCNVRDMAVVKDIFRLLPRPELLHRLTFTARMDALYHAASYLETLSPHMQHFTELCSFTSTTNGMFVFSTMPTVNLRTMYRNITGLFQSWKNLQEIDLGGNCFTNCVGKMLISLEQPLKKLNISATALSKADMMHLAKSHHAGSLVSLNLDHNDLHKLRESTRCLFENLTSIVFLRTCNCQLNAQDSFSLATALSHSQTLKTWNLLQNRLRNLSELKQFVHCCSGIPSLKEIGCKPVDFHAFFSGLLIENPAHAMLTDREREEIMELANRLNLMVF